MEYLGWSIRDRGLAEGLILHEDSLNRWGIPHREAQDPTNSGWFEVDPIVDHAEAAFEKWREENKTTEPGVQPVVRLDLRAKKAAAARRRRRAQEAAQAAQEPPSTPA